jgi:hypothetical protein
MSKKNEEIREKFIELLSIIEQERAYFIELQSPGFSREEVDIISGIRPLPDELYALYSCIQGLNPANKKRIPLDGKSFEIMPSFELLHPAKIKGHIDFQNEESGFFQYLSWKPDMIPFMEGNCSVCCIRTLEEDKSICIIDKLDCMDDDITAFRDLEEMIVKTQECYIKGGYYVDSYGELQADYDIAGNILPW